MNRIIRVNQQALARLDREIILPGPRFGMRGRYKLEAVNVGDGRRRFLADFPNLITDVGLERIAVASSPNYLQNCYVGSGNTAPAFGDTALVALVASTATLQASTATTQPSSPYFGTRANTYRFAQGAAAGNLAEIGIGNASTNLFSRALILDGGGSPTTITVLSTEFLDCTYTFECIVPLVDVTGNVTIAAVSYAYTLRAANATAGSQWASSAGGSPATPGSLAVYSGAIGAITSSPGGTQANADSNVVASYTPGSHLLSTTSTWGLNSANFGAGGITAAAFSTTNSVSGIGNFQWSFTPFIPKDATKILTLTATIAWARM
jgi:hypothetical protein